MKLILADDHPLFLEGLKTVLKDKGQLVIEATAKSGQEAWQKVNELRPDILITDLMMPGMDGIELAEAISSNKELSTKVLILSTYESDEYIRKALKAGVAGFITKDAVETEILTAIETINNGKEYFGRNIFSKVLDIIRKPVEMEAIKLTNREKEVLQLLSEGLENKEIADKLFVSVHTVANHRASMLQKFEVKNTIQLINRAKELKLLDQ